MGIAITFVANIGFVANDIGMSARMCKVKGERIAKVIGASIVIVTQSFRIEIRVGTSGSRNARVDGTSVLVVASGEIDVGPHALVVQIEDRVEFTFVDGTCVEVVAIDVDLARRLGRTQIREVDQTGERVALVRSTHGVRRSGDRLFRTSGEGIAGVDFTQIGALAIDIGILAVGKGDISGHKTFINGASVSVITITREVALGGSGAQVGVHDEAGG